MLSIFIATSLNGHIARPDGDFSWLFTDQDYGYSEYLKDVTGIVMGGETYRVCRGLGDWSLPDKPVLVITRTERPAADTPGNMRFAYEDPVEAVKAFAAEVGGKVWLMGGGQVNTLLWNAGLVSELVNSVHPIWLKDGIPMLTPEMEERSMRLEDCKAFGTGLVQLRYSV